METTAGITSVAIAATEPGATLFVLCFRTGVPPSEGPHPVAETELRAAFVAEAGWRLSALEESEIEVTFDPGAFPAWLLTAERCRQA